MKTWVKLYTEINRDPKMAQFDSEPESARMGVLKRAGSEGVLLFGSCHTQPNTVVGKAPSTRRISVLAARLSNDG